MSHPLASPWTVFYMIEPNDTQFKPGLHVLGRFESIEQFWDLYTHLKKPNKTPDLLLGYFTKAFKMDQEDPNLKTGGKLIISIPKELLIYQWERLIITAVCGTLDPAIVGFSTKYNEEKITIWVNNMKLMDFVEDYIVDLLGIDTDTEVTRASFS